MRGVVFGWYHRRNAGDDRLAQCIERWLDGHQLTFLPHTDPPPLETLLHADFAIIGGGSVAGTSHGVFHRAHKWISAAQLPVACVGISVNERRDIRDEIHGLLRCGARVWVRDRPGVEWLGNRDNVFYAPDLSWMYPRESVAGAPRAGIAINLRPWPGRTLDAAAWRASLDQLPSSLTPWPLSFGRDDDRSVLKEVMPAHPNPAEFDSNVPAQCKLVIAMRYHAVLFAIQAGTPVLAVDNSIKVRRFLDEVGFSQCTVPMENPGDLRRAIDTVTETMSLPALLAIKEEMRDLALRAANDTRIFLEARAANQASPRRRMRRKILEMLTKAVLT